MVQRLSRTFGRVFSSAVTIGGVHLITADSKRKPMKMMKRLSWGNLPSLISPLQMRPAFYFATALFMLLTLCCHASGLPFECTCSLVEFRRNHSATLLPNGKVLAAGGGNKYGYVPRAEIYDPSASTNKWSVTGSMQEARYWHTATLLPNGKVLAAGGYGCNSAELYDPASATWTATGPMKDARDQFVAILLQNGRVLVAGGRYDSSYLSSSELYDPGTGTWSASGPMATLRGLHSATLLPDGKVLVAGGVQRQRRPSIKRRAF